MELRHLRYFVAIGEEEHFGRAAARLRIAQPALSRQIRDLESELGFDLFHRLPRGVRLTEAGKVFLVDAQKLMSQLERAVEHGRAVDSGKVGRLRIGFNESASWDGPMPRSILTFREAYPSIELEVVPQSSIDQLDALCRSSIDAAFAYNVGPDPDGMSRLRIESNDVALALPRGHRLARLRREISLVDLPDENFVWVSRKASPDFHDRIMDGCRRGGLVPAVVQQAASESVVLSLVAAGGVVGFVLETSAKRAPHGVVLRRVSDLSILFNLDLVWLAARTSPPLELFLGTVSSVVGREMPRSGADASGKEMPVRNSAT